MIAMDKNKTKPKNKAKLKMKTGLLLMQILLPFGLYAAMQIDSQLAAWLVASAFSLSMIAMVWVG